MCNLEPISSQNAMTYKVIRLNALRESPYAFGSTYARELKLTDDEWHVRANNWNRPDAIALLARDQNNYCGLVAAECQQFNPGCSNVYSMWVAPDYRKKGVGRTLIEGIETWAKKFGIHKLHLMVISNNFVAMSFYGKLSFLETGHTEIYPNDPTLFEIELYKNI